MRCKSNLTVVDFVDCLGEYLLFSLDIKGKLFAKIWGRMEDISFLSESEHGRLEELISKRSRDDIWRNGVDVVLRAEVTAIALK